jgi:phosphoglucosamine mutase
MCPDGILSAMRVIELVQNKGPLSRLLDDIPSYPTIREKIDCQEEQKETIMKKAEKELSLLFEDVLDVNLQDGVRISLKDGSWVLVRPSGTESFIRITLEAKTVQKAHMIRDHAAKFIEELL